MCFAVCLVFAQISVTELSCQSQSGHLNKALSGRLLGWRHFILHFLIDLDAGIKCTLALGQAQGLLQLWDRNYG